MLTFLKPNSSISRSAGATSLICLPPNLTVQATSFLTEILRLMLLVRTWQALSGVLSSSKQGPEGCLKLLHLGSFGNQKLTPYASVLVSSQSGAWDPNPERHDSKTEVWEVTKSIDSSFHTTRRSITAKQPSINRPFSLGTKFLEAQK